MKLSKYILPTLKEDPADAVVLSHRLMTRAGLIRKEAAGMYVYLPLGLRALRKVMEIIREEMDRAGALEFLMPELTSADLWKESGRWELMGREMIRIKDRNGLEYALAPTHEESFTACIRQILSSYRELPVTAYQMNTKFRDEIRPRYGIIRSKEFIMKDAYSFDIDAGGLELSYQSMRKAYRRIFERCGLETIPVEADTGNMGGSNSEEFMVASEVGEETLLLCANCSYRANQEKAEFARPALSSADEAPEDLEKAETPDVKTIENLTAFFNCSPDRFIKSLLYMADGEAVMAFVSGDRDVNENKLRNFLGASELELASDEIVRHKTGAPAGFAGPLGLKGVKMVFDLSIAGIRNGITGANKTDTHFVGVNPGRDFNIEIEADICSAREGDACPRCSYAMAEKKGIEVGHIFKLGYKYTEAMNFTVLNENGKSVVPIMGCYGIGVNRTLAAIVEQHNDDKGIIWPFTIAPYTVHLTGLFKGDDEKKLCDELYDIISSAGIEVLYDDRKGSPGFKFADADLIGLPLRVTAGKNYFSDGEIEIKVRAGGEVIKTTKDKLVASIRSLIV